MRYKMGAIMEGTRFEVLTNESDEVVNTSFSALDLLTVRTARWLEPWHQRSYSEYKDALSPSQCEHASEM